MEPAKLFSTGRQAKSHSPLTVASKASSNDGYPMACESGAKAYAASSLNAPATPWNATRVTVVTDMRESLLQHLDLAAEAGETHGDLVQVLAQLLEPLQLGAHEARVGADRARQLLLRARQLLLELAADALDQALLELAHAVSELALRLRTLPRQDEEAHAHEREPERDARHVKRGGGDER